LIPGELLGRLRPGTAIELGPDINCVISHPNWWTPFTSMFMHGGWFHIIGNMWFLWVFGNNVEDVMGRARFVVFYVLCGLAAAAAQTFSNPSSAIPMVGASGAIGGVMGAYAFLYPRAHVHTLIILGFYMRTVAVPASFMLGYWFLLQILGGLPKLGVASGAAATVVSFVVSTVWLAFGLRSKKSPLAPDAELLRDLRVNVGLLRLVVKIGLPTGLQMIVISLAEIVLLALVNSFGSDATAAYGAVNQIVNYVQFPALSIAITTSVLGAQAIGANRNDRLAAITRTGMHMNLCITGGLVILGYFLSRHILGFFITSAPVIELAQTLLHIMLWSSVVYGFASVLSGVMRASGAVLVPTAISIFCIVAVEVPSAYALADRIGIRGVWMAYPIAFLSMLVLQTAYYQLVWRKSKIKRLV